MPSKADLRRVLALYERARKHVLQEGYGFEVEWQRSANILAFTESDFLRETAWVILCSGFREEIVRRKFGYISLCFCDWCSAEEIVSKENLCRSTAFAAFKNKRKIDAIITTAKKLYKSGFACIKDKVLKSPIDVLSSFPYIGKITAYHLAKNLGFDVCKADVHLQRLARILGWEGPWAMCQLISDQTGEKIAVVDIVLWRYAALGKLKGCRW